MTLTADAARMQCMEVWGGNHETDRSFELPGLNVWVNSRPDGEAIAGGDVYYLSSCASGRITRMLLADVAGHGEAAAQVAVGLRDVMRENVNVIRQDRLVGEMNRRFSDFTSETQFATAVVATYFAPTRMLMLSNAGHPPPLYFSARRNRWTVVEADPQTEDRGTISGTPWGVYDKAIYPTYRMKLQPGDRLLCYSDAVIEAMLENGEQLGVEGLQERLISDRHVASSEVIPRLLDAINPVAPVDEIADDMTLMLLEASGSRVSLKNNLLAPFRLLRPVRLHTSLK